MIPKFRAWLKDVKRMVDVEFLDLSHKMLIGKDWEYGMTESIKFDEVALMQSTGIFDENGVEIFEGDIVLYEDKVKTICQFEKGAFRLFHTMFFSGVIGKAKKENLEVIGNIYANPELMEEKNV